jgi:hypothetical protein
MADSTQRVRSASGKSGSAVLKEPFQHLIQHIKQTDPMLYEALRKLTEFLAAHGNILDELTKITPTVSVTQQDKCTFGLVKTLEVKNGITLFYICRKAGKFQDFAAKIKTQAPTGSDAILDVKLSEDDAASWNSIFPSGSEIILPDGETDTVIVDEFDIPNISVGNILRIDCLQIGSINPGKGIEVVGRWTSTE